MRVHCADKRARAAVVLLNGVRQSHVIEAHEGPIGSVRRLMMIGDKFVFDFGASRVIEIVEYGEVRVLAPVGEA